MPLATHIDIKYPRIYFEDIFSFFGKSSRTKCISFCPHAWKPWKGVSRVQKGAR